MKTDRRRFLTLASGAALLSPTLLGAAPKPADVNATEDLMREHGVLRRVLLVYEEGERRIRKGEAWTAIVPTVTAGALIIQRFIENYHELLEERFLFPRFTNHPTLGPLVTTLLAQHRAGRALTSRVLSASKAAPKNAAGVTAFADALIAFSRMYRPHAAREDTELFPAFHALFSAKEFDALGDRFEEEEHKALGEGGFEGAVREVAQLESALGIADLASFTPVVGP